MGVTVENNRIAPAATRIDIDLPILISDLAFHQARQDEASTYRFVRQKWSELQKSERADRLDLLLVVRSLPFTNGNTSAYDLAARSMIPVTRVLEVGGECTAVLEAIMIAAQAMVDGAQTAMIVVNDNFETLVDAMTIQQKPDTTEWKNATSIISMGRRAQQRFRATALASISDPRFCEMVTAVSALDGQAFRFRPRPDFHDVDLRNERLALNMALPTIPAESALVMTNRSIARFHAARGNLSGYKKLYYSRSEIGHTGGSDVVWNWRLLTKDPEADRIDHIALCGNGIGYTWKVLALERG